jgi:hypothetical protein
MPTRARGAGLKAGRGRAHMYNDAYFVLDAIDRGAEINPSEKARWVEALKAIRWIVPTNGGFALTAAGRQARDEMASSARKRSAG